MITFTTISRAIFWMFVHIKTSHAYGAFLTYVYGYAINATVEPNRINNNAYLGFQNSPNFFNNIEDCTIPESNRLWNHMSVKINNSVSCVPCVKWHFINVQRLFQIESHRVRNIIGSTKGVQLHPTMISGTCWVHLTNKSNYQAGTILRSVIIWSLALQRSRKCYSQVF